MIIFWFADFVLGLAYISKNNTIILSVVTGIGILFKFNGHLVCKYVIPRSLAKVKDRLGATKIWTYSNGEVWLFERRVFVLTILWTHEFRYIPIGKGGFFLNDFYIILEKDSSWLLIHTKLSYPLLVPKKYFLLLGWQYFIRTIC